MENKNIMRKMHTLQIFLYAKPGGIYIADTYTHILSLRLYYFCWNLYDMCSPGRVHVDRVRGWFSPPPPPLITAKTHILYEYARNLRRSKRRFRFFERTPIL